MAHPTPVHEILHRVERRELQVDVAARRIFDIFHGEPEQAQPEEQVAETSAPPSPPTGVLTSYNAMEHNKHDNGEGIPLSEDQLAELEAAEEAGDDDLADTLRSEGYEVVEGADAVRAAIEDAAEPHDDDPSLEA